MRHPERAAAVLLATMFVVVGAVAGILWGVGAIVGVLAVAATLVALARA